MTKTVIISHREFVTSDYPCTFIISRLIQLGAPVKWKFKPLLRDADFGDVTFDRKVEMQSHPSTHDFHFRWSVEKNKALDGINVKA